MTTVEFLDLFPEFNCESDSRIKMALDTNSCMINKEVFGELYESALAFYTAHELFIFNKNKGSIVSSEKVGDVSRNYYNSSDGDSFFTQSQYGMKYLQIRNSVPKTPVVLSGEIDCY